MVKSPLVSIINKKVSSDLAGIFSYGKFQDLNSCKLLFQTIQWVVISYKGKFCRRKNEWSLKLLDYFYQTLVRLNNYCSNWDFFVGKKFIRGRYAFLCNLILKYGFFNFFSDSENVSFFVRAISRPISLYVAAQLVMHF